MLKSFIDYKQHHGNVAVIIIIFNNVKLFNNTFNVYLLSRQAQFLPHGTNFYQSNKKQVSNNILYIPSFCIRDFVFQSCF